MNLQKNITRQEILNIEEYIKSIPGSVIGDSDLCPLKHTFADGIYVREIFIPANTYLVGKIHKESHPIFLLSGTLYLITEFENKIITGPCHFISPAGCKRAAYAETDLIWVTVHANPTNTEKLDELEDIIISETFESFAISQKNNFIN